MRILKISGQNIASLADRFEIDLDAEPLRSAGLFAITGQTGAGKSSLLDAMCLALYGDAPRLSSGKGSDEVPDPGGEVIQAKDPRAILRKGAVQGWASVCFTGIDGQVYEATWTTRRARDRAEGKLQNVERRLARLSDGQVLASQKSQVAEQIVALTGLSYEEFRRTVLLAQGDFDAFLRADDGDRAALLEKVTGTGLYRAISTRIYEKTSNAETALKLLTHERDAHHLLTPEETAALQAERTALIPVLAAARDARARLEADLTRHRRLAEAEAQLAQAEAAHSTAQAAHQAAEADRALLAQLDRAEPLRLPFEAARGAQVAFGQARQTLNQTETTLARATHAEAQHRTAAQTAAQAHEAEEAAFKHFGPIWTRATQLDSRITDAAAELTEADAQVDTAAQSLQTAQSNCATLHQRKAELLADLAQAEASLARLAPLAPLVAGWHTLLRDLDEHDATQTAQQLAEAEATQLSQRSTDFAARLHALDQDEATALAQFQAIEAEIATLTRQIATLDAAAPQQRLSRLNLILNGLTALDHIAADHATAQTALRDAMSAIAGAEAEQHTAHSIVTQTTASLTEAEARISALTAPAEQAGLAVSDSARNLRLHLQPDQPCPVCGALDHPNHADAALATLANRLRASLEAARTAATTARQRITRAQGDEAGAIARKHQASHAATDLTRRLTTSEAAFAAQRAPLIGLIDCPPLPITPTRLTSELATLTNTCAEVVAQLSHLAQLRHTKETADNHRAKVRAARDQRATTRTTLLAERAEGDTALALARQQATTARTRRQSLADQLAPLLSSAGEPLQSANLRQSLHAKAQHFTDAQAQVKALAGALDIITPHLATAEAEAAQGQNHLQTATQTRAARLQARGTLQAERATLLQGEETEAHRSRHNLARLAAAQAKDAAAQSLAAAQSAQGQAHGYHSSAAQAIAQTEAAAETAELTLARALADRSLSLAEIALLLDLPRTETETLRLRLRGMEDAIIAANASATARRADLAALRAAGPPETSAEALTQAITTEDHAQSGRQERLGALNTRLLADAEQRAALQDLAGSIAAAEATLQVWQAVNAAVGSRSGDAFARIAQSITLDVLVDHANHHLADLNPRYRLQRASGLALQVLDMDMGADPRATRSLSGGERFLVSLALALALSRMGEKGALAATLFIDEGFGSLDMETLDVAIDALETLQSQGRTIGVISHVEAMKERIPVQIRVRRQGNGKSSLIVIGGPQP